MITAESELRAAIERRDTLLEEWDRIKTEQAFLAAQRVLVEEKLAGARSDVWLWEARARAEAEVGR